MGNVRLYGATSGYTELAPPAVAPDGVVSLPSGTGTLVTTADVAALVGAGKILQVVAAATGAQVTIASATITSSGVTATITPSSTSSKILVMASFNVIAEPTGNQYLHLYRGTVAGTSLGQFLHQNVAYGLNATQSIIDLDSPATTSATTYTVAGASNGGSLTFQYAGSKSTIILLEVAG